LNSEVLFLREINYSKSGSNRNSFLTGEQKLMIPFQEHIRAEEILDELNILEE
jgi:hypothetical protein